MVWRGKYQLSGEKHIFRVPMQVSLTCTYFTPQFPGRWTSINSVAMWHKTWAIRVYRPLAKNPLTHPPLWTQWVGSNWKLNGWFFNVNNNSCENNIKNPRWRGRLKWLKTGFSSSTFSVFQFITPSIPFACPFDLSTVPIPHWYPFIFLFRVSAYKLFHWYHLFSFLVAFLFAEDTENSGGLWDMYIGSAYIIILYRDMDIYRGSAYIIKMPYRVN